MSQDNENKISEEDYIPVGTSAILGNLDEDDSEESQSGLSIQEKLKKMKEYELGKYPIDSINDIKVKSSSNVTIDNTNIISENIEENKEEKIDIKEEKEDDINKEDLLNKDAKEAFTEETIEAEKEEENESNLIFKSFSDTNAIKNDKNLLDKIVVDLSNIEIVEKSPLGQVEDMKYIFNGNTQTFPVVCCQSAYSAQMSGLTITEKNAINNPYLNQYQSRKILYETVYNKIKSMSVQKPDKFDQWLKITSWGDLDTLLFGIYCMTFIDNNDFDITCGKCKKKTSVTVNNQSLIEVRDKEVYSKIDEIIYATNSYEALQKNSQLNKKIRTILPESKIIIDIHTPSLYHHLSLLQQSKPEMIEKYSDAFGAMLFISNVFMLDVKRTIKSGKPSYYEVTQKPRILDILLNLSNLDGETLENFISDKMKKYKIEYQIRNVVCASCNESIKKIPINIEAILFTRINRQKTENTK